MTEGERAISLVDGKPDQQRRSPLRRARHFDRPAGRVNGSGEADESGTTGRIGPAAAIVADRKPGLRFPRFEGDMPAEACACFAVLVSASDTM